MGAYEAGLAVRSYEEAEAHRIRRAATVRVNQAIERLNKAQGWVENWEDSCQFKYYIVYNHAASRIEHVYSVLYRTASIFLPMSYETAKAVSKSHEADILTAMGVVK